MKPDASVPNLSYRTNSTRAAFLKTATRLTANALNSFKPHAIAGRNSMQRKSGETFQFEESETCEAIVNPKLNQSQSRVVLFFIKAQIHR